MSREKKTSYIGMSAEERRLIEVIRESKEAKQIVENFIFGPPKFLTAPQEPSDVQETSP